MAEEYSQEELQELYDNLPENLKEAVDSETVAYQVYDACSKNNIEDDRETEVLKYVGRVFLGLLSPNEFEKTLAKELKLNNDVAKNVANEIRAVVFYPVKESLEALYKITIEESERPTKEFALEEKSKARRKKDAYREPLE